MNLPSGISYHWQPRKEWQALITRGGRGLIRIDGNSDYTIHDRLFEKANAPFLKGDWEDFDRLFQPMGLGLDAEPGLVYSGAEHDGEPKRPDITVVPNLFTGCGARQEQLMVFGCTIGHYHLNEPTTCRVQEVYEFQTHGLMALDREQGEIELWVAQDGDKVAVPNACHMTLYNLGGQDEPLVTLDFANPERNPTDHKEFVRRFGPVLLIYHNGSEVVFRLNRLYINNPAHKAGVRLSAAPGALEDRQVEIPLGTRPTLGWYLYRQLTGAPHVIEQFAKLGIRVRRASPAAILEEVEAESSQGDLRIQLTAPLIESVKPGTEGYRYFFPQMDRTRPSPY